MIYHPYIATEGQSGNYNQVSLGLLLFSKDRRPYRTLFCFPFILQHMRLYIATSKSTTAEHRWSNTRSGVHSSEMHFSLLFLHSPLVFQCGPKTTCQNRGRRQTKCESGGRQRQLLRCPPLLLYTHTKHGFWALPQPPESALVSQLHFPECHRCSFHSLSWSAPRKAKKAK